MSISFIAAVSIDAGNGNVSITHGLTIAAGDVIIATVNANGAGNTVTDNNGSTPFTADHFTENPDSARYYVFSRVCGGSEPASYAFTLGSSARWSIVLRQYRGVDSSVWDVAPGAGTVNTSLGDTAVTVPDITILTDGACGLALAGDDYAPTTTTYTSNNAAYGNEQAESGQQFQVTMDKLGLSTGATGTFTITCSAFVSYACYHVALKPGTAAIIEQEGFRFGVDDGSESAHTWEAAQDTNITTAAALTKLIRGILNTTNDLSATTFKLKYQKNGSGGYVDVPVGASGAGTTPVIEAADTTSSGDNATTPTSPWAVSRPTAATGDLLIAIVGWDDSTTNTGISLAAGPNGETWTQINSVVASASTEVRMTAYYTVATGTWGAGTIAVTPNANEQWTATVIKVLAGEFDASTPIGASATRASAGTAETASLSPALSAGASDGGGRLVWAVTTDTDPLVTLQAGNTSIANNDRGNEALGVAIRDTAVTNSESIAGGATWSLASDSWCSLTFVVRAPLITNDVYVDTSTNIATGGEATTARLTAPSGKSGNFTTGRRWDDENGTDTIDIASSYYTEVEWCIALKSGLSGGDYFDFRIYAADVAFDTYTLTPRWTVATSSGIPFFFQTEKLSGNLQTLTGGLQ